MITYNFTEKIFFQLGEIKKSIVIHPTNSCYGFAASIYNQKGYERIFEIKGREKKKPFFITLRDSDDLGKLALADKRIQKYLINFPEKTFTFILKRSHSLPRYINPDCDTIGVQIAKGVLIDICNLYGSPIFGTSANLSGSDPIYNSNEIKKIFGKYSDIIFLNAGELEKSAPSTIIDLTQTPEIILRGTL